MRKLRKIFIAGIGQRDDYQAIINVSRNICEKHGFELVNNGYGYWDILFAIRSCDVVIANLNPNQGILVDGETEFQVGAAAMIGKKIYGYCSNSDLNQINPIIVAPATLIDGSFEDCVRAI